MSLRWVPPAHSPVSVAELIRGALAAPGVSNSDAHAVTDVLVRTFGESRITLTDSGTSALTLALQTLASPGAAVAFPAYCCIDLVTAAQGAGVTVRLYDVDPATLSPDLDSLRRTVERGVVAILVTPLFGYPVDIAGVTEIAAAAGIPVLEDAAQGAGATYDGRRVGAFGAVSVLSFSRGKGTTGGSGGALLVRDPAWFERASSVTARIGSAGAGWSDVIKLSAQWILGRPSLYWMPASIPALRLGEMIYHPPHPPTAISNAACSMLRTALSLDDGEVAARRARAREIVASASAASDRAPVTPVPRGMPGYLRLAALDRGGRATEAPRLGILRGYPITLDQHEATRTVLADGEIAGEGAATLRDRLFTLPVHSRMGAEDVRRVQSWLAGRTTGS